MSNGDVAVATLIIISSAMETGRETSNSQSNGILNRCSAAELPGQNHVQVRTKSWGWT